MTLRDDLEFRGLVHQVSDPAVFDRLNAGGVTAYVGFDPTAASLHLGHLLQICTLRRLQLAGNRPIMVAGGGTGLIGDPTFRTAERPYLSMDELQFNLAAIRGQLARFLELAPHADGRSADQADSTAALLVDNSTWLAPLGVIEFLRDVGKHFTVNQLIARESVKSRIDDPQASLSFTEFSYALLQAYDFLQLHLTYGCTLQLGGSDQWTNILSGVELIKRTTGAQTFCITTPLLLRPDGTKFGKSDSPTGLVWLDPQRTSPFRLYQFLFNASDEMVSTYLRYFTFLSREEIESLEAETQRAPQARLAQQRLAAEVVAFVHGSDAASAAARASGALFADAISELDEGTLLEAMADAPTSEFSREEFASWDLPTVLVRTQLAASKGEARRFVEQGGVYVNNVRVSDDSGVRTDAALHGRYLVVRRGPRQTHLVVLV